jgi:ATP-dependent helicase/nuclease subunit A
METDDLEIKRQIDSASNQIRVMTVHGAKGLESPVVILPDCGRREVRVRDEILSLDGAPVWKTPSDTMPARMAAAFEDRKSRDLEERLRLLYVAMTRAEKWLIVAAAGDLPREESTWYQMVETALDALGAETTDMNGLSVKRLTNGDWAGLRHIERKAQSVETAVLEPFYRQPAPPASPKRETISPSDLGGAKALPGEANRDEDAAKAFGTLVHLHLEQMAATTPERWPAIAAAFAAEPEAELAFHQARAILERPDLRPLFGPDSLAEVALSADLGSARLNGVADRLLVGDDHVLVVDFKTNATVPSTPAECPNGLLRQMGAYAGALAQIYPGRRIETAILWTAGAHLMMLPPDLVSDELDRALAERTTS